VKYAPWTIQQQDLALPEVKREIEAVHAGVGFHQLTITNANYPLNSTLFGDVALCRHLPKKSGEFLVEIIRRRHELRSTMITSNRPLEDWGKLIGDIPAVAILDRFLQDAELIQITGRRYRLRGDKN